MRMQLGHHESAEKTLLHGLELEAAAESKEPKP